MSARDCENGLPANATAFAASRGCASLATANRRSENPAGGGGVGGAKAAREQRYHEWEERLRTTSIDDLTTFERIDLRDDGWLKIWQRYTSTERADMRASFRLGYRQRESLGTTFWTHLASPGIAYPTRIAALRAASRALGLLEGEGGAVGSETPSAEGAQTHNDEVCDGDKKT